MTRIDPKYLLDKGVIPIKVRPNARRTEIIGEQAGFLVIAVAAPPEKGKANAEIEKFLTRMTGRTARIKSGLASRKKQVVFE